MTSKEKKELLKTASAMVDMPNAFDQVEKVKMVRELEKLAGSGSSWWIILLKVLAYALGLILGGAATTSCIHLIG